MTEILYLTIYSLLPVFHSSSPQVKVVTNCTINIPGVIISILLSTSIEVLIASWLMSAGAQKSHFRIFFFQTTPFANYLRSVVLANRFWDEGFVYKNFIGNAIRNNTCKGVRMQDWAKWWVKLQSGYHKVLNWSIGTLELRQPFRLFLNCSKGTRSHRLPLW